jgi:hypothetical protein
MTLYKEIHCLETIDWESAYVSASGLRAPPWRQSDGDLGYVVVGGSHLDSSRAPSALPPMFWMVLNSLTQWARKPARGMLGPGTEL